MLIDIHNDIRRLLFQSGGIDASGVEVAFELPTKEWVESLTRPTINLFLFDIQENTELRQTNIQTTRGNGNIIMRVPPRRFDLRYMACVFTTVIEDEHLLLWRVLVTLLKYQQLPAEILSAPLCSLEPPLATKILRSDEGPRLMDIWNALGLPPRPALTYVVTVPVDLNTTIGAPLILTRTAQYKRGADRPETYFHIGGIVRDERGQPLVGVKVNIAGSATETKLSNAVGEFALQGLRPGPVTLRLTRPDGASMLKNFQVPSDSYEVVWE